MLVIPLDDVLKVITVFNLDDEDMDYIYSELEQKAYVDFGEKKDLLDYIMDINPAEIAYHIEKGDLKNWCNSWQVGIQMRMLQMEKYDV